MPDAYEASLGPLSFATTPDESPL
eukprot:COSAG06_NODE_17752_length_923_cov_1.148058_2_plen_23_part_01